MLFDKGMSYPFHVWALIFGFLGWHGRPRGLCGKCLFGFFGASPIDLFLFDICRIRGLVAELAFRLLGRSYEAAGGL